MSETWFISDLHLDPQQPHRLQLFQQFMSHIPNDLDHLYILGDLFEYWLGDDVLKSPLGSVLQPIISALTSLNDKGIPVSFIHGNRDFLIGDAFSQITGIQLLAEQVVIDLYGKPVMIMHGDTLCSDDIDYQQFRQQSRSQAWQQAILALTLEERIAKAKQLRQISGEQMQQKAEAIMDVNQTTVEQVMLDAQVELLIHGHTHRPQVHHFTYQQQDVTHKMTRVVLGDWQKSSSILKVSANGYDLSDGR